MATIDTDGVINALLDALIPELNKALPPAIVAAGLDPWPTVVSGSDTLGKINLGICKASVKASYSIKDMTGLSSIEILAASVDGSSVTLPDGSASGTMNMNGRLNKSLTAKVSGTLKAGCGGLNEHVTISGSVSAKGVTAKVKGTYGATVGVPQSCLTSAHVDALTLDYSDLTIKIDGLGIFNDFLKPLEDAVLSLFKSQINSTIAAAVKPILNDLIEDELPFCIAVTDTSGATTAASTAA